MSDYLIVGRKGAGKSIFAVGTIRDALARGRRVATNLDIFLDEMFSPHSRITMTRLPDRPTLADLEALGRGQDGVVEEENGVLVLDEVSAFLNARSWSDKSRQGMLDWFIHSRKLGWDVYYIAQGPSQVDSQLRTTQMEYTVTMRSTGKWPVPLLSPILKAFLNINLHFPKGHLGVITQGQGVGSLIIGRRWYRGVDLYNCYATQQIFLPSDHPQAVGMHSVLSAWHLKGRYLSWWKVNKAALAGGMMSGLILGALAGIGGHWWFSQPSSVVVPVFAENQIDRSMAARGAIVEGSRAVVTLADGSTVVASGIRRDSSGVYFRIGEHKWIPAAR